MKHSAQWEENERKNEEKRERALDIVDVYEKIQCARIDVGAQSAGLALSLTMISGRLFNANPARLTYFSVRLFFFPCCHYHRPLRDYSLFKRVESCLDVYRALYTYTYIYIQVRLTIETLLSTRLNAALGGAQLFFLLAPT